MKNENVISFYSCRTQSCCKIVPFWDLNRYALGISIPELLISYKIFAISILFDGLNNFYNGLIDQSFSMTSSLFFRDGNFWKVGHICYLGFYMNDTNMKPEPCKNMVVVKNHTNGLVQDIYWVIVFHLIESEDHFCSNSIVVAMLNGY